MKRLIKNVVMLDMTSATEESVKDLTVKNAVNVVVTSKTKPLLGEISFGNIVQVTEIPEDTEFTEENGSRVVEQAHIQSSSTKVYRVINGSILFTNDVTEETVKNMFPVGGSINGSIIFPSSISLDSLNVNINGSRKSYPHDSLLYRNHSKINNSFLQGLPESSSVSFIDGLSVAEDTDAGLFEKHIKKLTVYGETVLPQKLSDIFYRVARQYDQVVEIPDGYTFYDEYLIINSSSFLNFKGKSIYTRKNIIFRDGLNKDLLSQLDFRFESEKNVILPESIAAVMMDRVKAKQIYTYRGKLVHVREDMDFAAANESASYLIEPGSTLNIPDTVSAAELEKAIDDIFLLGEIKLQENQMQLVNDKVALYEGSIEINRPEAEEDEDDASEYDIVISNAVKFKL